MVNTASCRCLIGGKWMEAETDRFAHATLTLLRSLPRSKSSMAPERLRTWSGCSSTYSYVVKRASQTVHSRRLRTARPPRLARVSTTRFSVASHWGQRNAVPC